MGMEQRIEPLIEERAPWLFSNKLGIRKLRAYLMWLLDYRKTLKIGEDVEHMSWQDLMSYVGDMICQDVQVTGLENLPRQGAALIVANHPTGIADAVVLQHQIKQVRPNAFYFTNKDVLRVVPQLEHMIAPVEWRLEKRSHAKTRETMSFARTAIEAGRIGVIFPSGRLAKRRWLRLHERPWMASAAMMARKFDVPVIPVHIEARNSALFYLFDILHPTLRDITLFHELLNKARQPFRITIGEPISPSALPIKSDKGIEMLRKATLGLGQSGSPTVSLVDATRRPHWLKA